MIPRAAKRDASEPEVVKALECYGFSVLRLSVKDGPDLAVSKGNRTVLAEVKTGNKKLKPGQARFAERWQDRVVLLRCAEDVVRLAKEWV